jgi:hypothetical protein
MNAYNEEDELADKERILRALDALHALQAEYADVIAIPEIVTLHDITEYRLDDYRGIKQFKEIFDKAAAKYVLDCFAGQDFISPEYFEYTVISALEERKLEQNKNNRSK